MSGCIALGYTTSARIAINATKDKMETLIGSYSFGELDLPTNGGRGGI